MAEPAFPRLNDQQVTSLKVPPYSLEAEQAVLGGLMLVNDAWDNVAERLEETDFYRQDHRLIFRAMKQLVDRRHPFDVVTLSEAIDKLGELEAAGGLPYLGELAANTPSATNIKAYAEIVRERSILRQLIGTAHSIAERAFNPEGASSGDILDEAERKIFSIADHRPKMGGPDRVDHLVAGAMQRIDELYRSGSQLTGISTGFSDLDNMTSGLQPSDLIIVAGRPSMGKTSFAMNIIENTVLRNDKPVVVFSMEMSGESLIMRMLSSLGRIDYQKIRTGKLDEEDWPRLTSAMTLLTDRPLFVDGTPSLSPSDIRARLRRIVREHGDVGAVMIDYLQLMRVPGTSEGRVNEISEISRSLKALAKEFNVPVIALSQLNRSLEQRPNKRPVMSDLRESGAIEQDADLIMFIYRDEVYHEDSPNKGVAEIIIGKQRNGPIGTCRLAFLGKYTKFEDLAQGSYDNYE